ncbi:hypothetical protein SLEP1_g6871 [Rubroshorea leprosula]|uniref:Uncharacterized protein n=1 Tax=Rubroshorea leprosula TaxID=152421 RepID=A0AAV5I169_9ROSI|nr:hypothetical protein SLEP1_g6871 [Rubroshorea leprosula]
MAATGKAPEIQNSCSTNSSADSTGELMMGDSKAADLDKEERPEKTEMQDVEEGKETKVSSLNLGGHQSSYQHEISEFRRRQISHSHQVDIAGEVQNFPFPYILSN